MRELLYNAAKHYKRGRALADRGDVRGAMVAYGDALRDLHAVRPQRMRNVLLAQAYLSRYQIGIDLDPDAAASDLRMGYSYARTTQEPTVRHLAEELWTAHVHGRDGHAAVAMGLDGMKPGADGSHLDGRASAADASPTTAPDGAASDGRTAEERLSEDLPTT